MHRRVAAITCAFLALMRWAAAQEASQSAAASPHAGDFWSRDALTGDWGGERSFLESAGLLLGADTIDEVLGNPAGGVRRGVVYDGRLELLATVDLEKALGWTGATTHANAYELRGRGLSRNDLANNLETASNIEAARSFRLFDLWLEQSLLNTRLSIRAGQIAADDEFITSQTAATFINGTFGWPAIVSTDLPNGGPAYPLATPGMRVKYALTETLSGQIGVFNGDPAGAGTSDPQFADASGTAFRLGGTAFAIMEGDYAVNQDPNAPGLAASYKAGVWFHSGPFGSPTSTGIPATHQNDAGAYLVADNAVLHEGEKQVTVFARVAAAPSDRNPVSLYGDAGVNFGGFFAERSSDVLGLAVAVAVAGTSEAVAEATYRAQVTPWWSVQPDLQFIRHPGAGVTTVGAPRPRDALVVAVRSAIVF